MLHGLADTAFSMYRDEEATKHKHRPESLANGTLPQQHDTQKVEEACTVADGPVCPGHTGLSKLDQMLNEACVVSRCG